MSEIATRNPAQELISTLRRDDFKEQIQIALPPSVTPDKFVRVATTAIMANPDLVEADRESVIRSFIQCAQMGLLPDGTEAALVIFNSKVKTPQGDQWIKKAQLLAMVGGYRKIAAEHGWTIRTGVVYANDEFDYDPVEAQLKHRPLRPGMPRGDKIAAWAKAVHKDGRVEIDVMDAAEIAKVRAVSRAAERGPWVDWEERMWEKSPARRIFKKLPLSEADRERIIGLLASELEPGEAAARLYGGPAAVTPAALEASETDTVDAPSTSAAGETQQADGAATEQPLPAHTAPSATGDEELPGEPAPDEPSAFQAPTAVVDDPIVTAANEAAQLIVPIGAWKGHSLAAVHAAGDKGTQWIKYALTHFDAQTGTTPSAEPKLEPGELAHAVWAFARVFAPDLFQAELARREAAA